MGTGNRSSKATTVAVNLPVPGWIAVSQQAAYKEFLSGMAELTNSYLKPDVKRKWVKIDLIMVPSAYFTSLLLGLKLNKPFAVREVRQPSPLKQDSSTALFYNVYDLSVLKDLFASTVPLKTKAYFCRNKEVSAPVTGGELTAKEKVALARKHAGTH